MFDAFNAKVWSIIGPVASIITARATALFGLVTGAIGMLDWSPLFNLFGASTDFNQKQVVALGGIMFVKGIFDEIVRRINDPLLKVQAAITADPEVKIAKKALKKTIAKTPVAK